MLFHYSKKIKFFHISILFVYLSTYTLPVFGFYSQFIVPDHQYEEQFLQHFDTTEDILSALIASGVEPQNYSLYTSEILRWKSDIEQRLPNNYTGNQLAQQIGYYLHDHVYDKYVLSATTLKEIFENRYFNCLSGTILMNIMLRAFGIDAQSIVLPTHVYTVARLDGKLVEIENTIREGLAISINKDAQDNFNKLTGFNYLDGQKQKVVIDWKGTVGLLYSNRAYFNATHNQYEQAFQNMMKAQVLLDHAPSEQRNLFTGYLNYSYHIYRNKKSSIQDYLRALSVLEEGIRQFPDKSILKGNYLTGLDIVLAKMIENQATDTEIDQFLTTSNLYLSPKESEKLQKVRYLRTGVYYLRTNSNLSEAKKNIISLWNLNKQDRVAKELIQEYSYKLVLSDLDQQPKLQENTELLNQLQVFPKELTEVSLGCYYSRLAENNFKANNFDQAVDIMLSSQKKLGNTKLIVQNGFVHAVNSAQYFLNNQQYEKAIDFYKKALHFRTDSSVVNNLGILYQQLISELLVKQQIAKARQLIQDSKKVVPNHPALKDIYRKYS